MSSHTHYCEHKHEHHPHDHPVTDCAMITHHEESIICTYETTVEQPLTAISRKIESLLEDIRNFVDTNGGLVGHIKAYLQECGDGIFLSTTGGRVQAQQVMGKSVQVTFTAIVFACDETALCREVEALFANLKESE